MMNSPPEIVAFHVENATDQQFQAWNTFSNRMQQEATPREPPVPLEQTKRNLRNPYPSTEIVRWAVWSPDGTELLARGALIMLTTNENRHMADTTLEVLPGWRRRKIATRLLGALAEVAQANGRRLLFFGTHDTVPAGEAFMRALGAHPGLAQHINELELADVDRDLLRHWRERARERASDFEVGIWEGPPYPESELETVRAMYEAANLVPKGELELEDFHWTIEEIRQADAVESRRGLVRWTACARQAGTGEVAGFTEVYWNPNQPDVMDQGLTAVFPQYQNRGIGRWLKAVLLEKILRDRPEVKRIHTGNADSNAPMLSINTQLGFKPYYASTVWQLETDRVQEYVTSKLREHADTIEGAFNRALQR